MSQKLKIVKRSEEEEERRRYRTKNKKEIKEEKVTISEKTEKSVEHIPEVQFTKIEEPVEIQPINIKSSVEIRIKIPNVMFQSIEESDVVTTPILTTEVSPKIVVPNLSSFSEIELNDQINPVQQKFNELIRIIPPEIRLEKISASQISFSQVSRLISGVDAYEEIEKEKVKEEQREAQTIINISEGVGKSEESLPDLFDMIFESKANKISKKIFGDGVKLICLWEPENSKYRGTVETICLRIYKEKVGGNPKATIIRKIDETTINDIIRWMEAREKIFTIDFGSKEIENLNEEDWKHIAERLEELFSDKAGFLIFSSKNKYDFDKLKDAILSLSHIPEIIPLTPKDLDFETKKKICSYIWGFVDLGDQFLDNFDILFEEARRRFKKKLSDVETIFEMVTKKHPIGDLGDKESSDHYDIKKFVVKYLAELLKLPREKAKIEERIKTEEEIYLNGEKIIPDIKVDSEVYEIETLFGTGNHPLTKIDDTLRKYEKSNLVKKVNIIMDSLTALLHINELIERKKEYNKNPNLDVDFFVIDVEKKDLVNIDAFASKISRIS